MKKVKYLLLILLCFLILPSCAKKEEKEFSSPLFFEVSKNGSTNKIYLLGSIHAADDTVYPLSNKIIDAYKNSDELAVEFDLIEYTKNIGAQVSMIQQFMYDDGENIKDYMNSNTYEKMKEILTEANLYTKLYDQYQPMIWSSLVENASMMKCGLDSENGIDMYFLNKAKNDKKAIFELESAELQYDIFLNLSDEFNIRLLEESVNDFDKGVSELQNLYEAYKKGSKEELESLLFEDDDEDDNQMKEYNDVLITKRNIGMYDNLNSEFESGKTIFCTVGLAHIIGPDGLVKLFEDNGYTVR